MSKASLEFNPLALCRANVRHLEPYTSARDEYVANGNEMIFLDANESPYETGLNRYPDPLQRSLKALWAAQKGVSESQILFGNGSDEVLDLLFRAFCEPSIDHIISLPPTYGMYGVLANINGIENVEIPLSSSFNIETEAVLKALSPQSKLTFICSPNNPSGNLMDFKAVTQILEQSPGLVVIDEAYIDFTTQDSFCTLLEQYPNLVVIQTLSKAYGMAGIRLGVLMASSEIVSILHKIKPPYNVNIRTQEQAALRLSDTAAVQKEIREIILERNRLEKALVAIPFVQELIPSQANFILVRVDHAGQRYEQLLEHGIVVRNRSKQLHCDNCLRFTVGTPQENKILLQKLASLA